MKFFRCLLNWIWCQPQTLFGSLLYLLVNKKSTVVNYEDSKACYLFSYWGAFSLGRYIFLCNEFKKDPNAIKHEYGHSIQSLYLGPLFFIVIGIPSFLFATFCVIAKKDDSFYKKFYTEKWADKLGGVK